MGQQYMYSCSVLWHGRRKHVETFDMLANVDLPSATAQELRAAFKGSPIMRRIFVDKWPQTFIINRSNVHWACLGIFPAGS
jgi:hypothetical protein